MELDKDKQELEQQLWTAAQKGDCKAIRTLAAMGVDINCRNEEGMSAFHIATRYNRIDAAQTVLAMKEAQSLRKMGIEDGPVKRSFGRRKAN